MNKGRTMRKLLIIAGLLFCSIAQAKVPSPKFKVGECLISKVDSDKVDPWQLDNVPVYKIDAVGKASYKTEAMLPSQRLPCLGNRELCKQYRDDQSRMPRQTRTLNQVAIIEFANQDVYVKVSCKKYLGE